MTTSYFIIGILTILLTTATSQRITSHSRQFLINLNDEVTLPCNVENSNSDYGVVWKRGDEVLFTDGSPMDETQTHYKLIEEGNNHSLYIGHVEAYDEANYTCMISDPSETIQVVHRILVHSPPAVSIIPHKKTIHPRYGEDVVLTCSATGNPVPTIKWIFKNGAMPLYASQDPPRGMLKLPNVDGSYAGTYECIATNKYNRQAHASISVKPVSNEDPVVKPLVLTDQTYIPTKQGESFDISCRYTGTPPPEVHWTLNEKSIDNNKHIVMTSKFEHNFTTTTLSLKDITADEFGDYKCIVSNGLGSDFKSIHVNDRPGRPFIHSKDNASLDWTVESALPIDQYRVYYRKAGEDKFIDFKTFSSTKSDQSGNVWSRNEKLDFLKPGTAYELQVKAQNKQGLGSFALDYEKVYIPLQDSETKGNANVATTSILSIPMILIGFLVFQ